MIKFTGYNEVELTINSLRRNLLIKPNETLLHVLRNKLGLTGAKGGCENGDCGACTVLIDGKPMKSCMLLAIECLDKEILTVEGIEGTEIQNAFIDFNGFQCGYCTSGFLMNAYAMLETNPTIDEDEMHTWLDSNLCRCTGYEGIELAVKDAQRNIINKKKASYP